MHNLKRRNKMGEAVNSIVTRLKYYEPNFLGNLERLKDIIMKNPTTYLVDLRDLGEIYQYDPKKVDWGKTRRSENKFINAISGTWLPIIGASLLPAALVQTPVGTIVTTIAGTIGEKLANKISENVTGNDIGTNVAIHTPLSPDLGEFVNPGTWIGGVLGNKYRSPIDKRWQLYRTKYSNLPKTPENLEDWKRLNLASKFYITDKTDVFNNHGDNLEVSGGLFYKPFSGSNAQIHFNPNIVYDKEFNVIGVNGSPSIRMTKEAKYLVDKVLENGTPLAQNENAMTYGLYLQQHPKAIITGEKPAKLAIEGYSTDIYPMLVKFTNHKKPLGYLEESVNTKITGTNIFGKSYNKLKDYFGKPHENGYVDFKDMTLEQVNKWNKELADIYGMHINPKTRTAENYIFVTGQKPHYYNLSILNNLLFNSLMLR